MTCEVCEKYGYDKIKIKPEEFKVTKKFKVKGLSELDKLAPDNEWVEVELKKPVKVKSVLTKGSKSIHKKKAIASR